MKLLVYFYELFHNTIITPIFSPVVATYSKKSFFATS